ncbi:MAG: hypothetical protein Q8936_12770 [Bacillota bacterium]|nr:hypothetical protein [Bacillota bacterium]
MLQIPTGNTTLDLVETIAKEDPYKDLLKGWTYNSSVLSIEEYGKLLYDLGTTDITVFEKLYPHLLPDIEAVLRWVSSTVLLPYFERLPREAHEAFKNRYVQELKNILSSKPVFFGFKRIIISAVKIE